MKERREIVQKLSDRYDINLLCGLLDIPKSSYYYVPVVRDDGDLRYAIEQTCLHYIRYGYRRVTPMVKKKHKVGKDRVRLLMKDMDLQVRKRRRKVRTTQSDGTSEYPNLIKGLDISYPDHVWCGDITYIGLMNGSVAYLAIILDIYTRVIRGWSLRLDMSEALIQESLSKALSTGHVPEIHHSDQGSQYNAHGYCMALSSLDIQISMAAKGKAWENPYIESAIGHLKDEEVWVKEYIDFQDAYSNLSYFLDVFYNHQRIHSSLGYITPAEFEAQYESHKSKDC
jgi:transposase InsO family protein